MYYFVLVIISILYLLTEKKNRARNRVFLSASFIVMLAVSTFRGYSVGGDLLNYIPLFDEIGKSSFESIFNGYTKYGYVFTCYIKAVSLISSNTTFILFAISLINLGFVFYFIRKHSCNYWLSLMIYISMAYYTNTFNSIRSSMALAVGMLAIHYLLENKNFKYLLLCIIAIEIHKTIFPVLFVYFLKKIKPSRILLVSAIAVSIILVNILNLDFFFNAIALYSDDYANMEASGSGYSMLALDIVLTLGAYFLLKDRIDTKSGLLINILCMATCIQAFAPVFSLTTRMALFFTVYIIVLLPDIIDNAFTPRSRKLARIVVVAVCLIYFQIFVMTPSMMYDDGVRSNSQRTIPYRFYWQTTSY